MKAAGLRALLGLHRLGLRLYPRRFRAEFEAEMQVVFAAALAEAARSGLLRVGGLCARELCDWPLAVLNAQLTDWLSNREAIPMTATTEISPASDQVSTSWAATVAGVLPFLLFGLASALRELPGGYDRFVYPASYGLMLAGVAVGGARGFPRWSLVYLGWGLVGTGWWVTTGMDALSQRLGFALGTDQRGWAAWAPLALALAVSLLLSRSLRPLRALTARLWQDWTWLSLIAYIFMAGVVLVFDENHHPHLLILIGAATLAAATGALLCLRGASVEQRGLGLLAGLALLTLIGAYADSTFDWRAYYNLPELPPVAPWQVFVQTVLAFSAWILVALAPVLWQWLRQKKRAEVAH